MVQTENSTDDNFRTGLATGERLDPAGERWDSSTVPASQLEGLVPPASDEHHGVFDRIADAAAKARSALFGDHVPHYDTTSERDAGHAMGAWAYRNYDANEKGGTIINSVKREANSLAAGASNLMHKVENKFESKPQLRDTSTLPFWFVDPTKKPEWSKQSDSDTVPRERNMQQNYDNGVRNLPSNTGDYKNLTDSTLGSVAIGLGPIVAAFAVTIWWHVIVPPF